jgi:hypothetical protein
MLGVAVLLLAGRVMAQEALVVFDDVLPDNWQNWSWDTTLTPVSAPVHGGSSALAADQGAAWAGVYLRAQIAPPAGYDTLRFWLHGGETGGQQINVDLYDESSRGVTALTLTAEAGRWVQVDVPLAALGSSDQLFGLVWQDNSGAAQATFYLDDIVLLQTGSGQALTQAGPRLTVDVTAAQRPISSLIYGINDYESSDALVATARPALIRWGGNHTSRYNYQLDITNSGSDWYFQSLPIALENPDALPRGNTVDRLLHRNTGTGIDTILTIPLIGWTTRAREELCGYRITVYGAQADSDPWRPDCGSGIRTDGTRIMDNDPTDTSIPIDPTFVQGWMQYLQSIFGDAAGDGVRFYGLDNEPSLWQETHRDVRPQPLGSEELRDLTYAYAAAIKASDPNALTLGPVEFGWTAYFYSGVDMAAQQWDNPSEGALRGGLPLAAWYLEQMRLYEEQQGVRILDYFDLHYYPSPPGVTLAPAGDAATQALRLRATRSLWDPSYVDESWINEPVMLIPRMRAWVDTHYPGTRLAITEYNFGGNEHLNGALAQADVLGIFGREGLDLATMWGPPLPEEPVAFAFRLYRNYDGSGGTFGETSVRAFSGDQDALSVYAALRADGALTVVVINKTGETLTSALEVLNFAGTNAQVYRYSSADLTQIVREADVALASGVLTHSFPANSLTLLVLGT